MSKPCVVIVDPYSSGAMLAHELQARNVPCIAVESSAELAPEMKSRFQPEDFPEVILHEGELEHTLQAVRRRQPTHVIAGSESGVELADLIAERLSLPGNDPRYRNARRDKYRMSEVLRDRGLRTAKQLRSSDVDEILSWIDATLDWPVIVKPLKSVASDHVFRCQNTDDVRSATQAILSRENILGHRNEAVLVQEFLAGTEYAIDMVALAGQKANTAIWQYSRSPAKREYVCYDTMTLLPYEGDVQDALRLRTAEVMDALGIRWGPAHCELMWVGDEPVFIEVGVRLSAGNNATLSRTCGGICQLDKTVEIIVAPERFLATLDDRPQLDRRAANVFLMPRTQGRLVCTHGLDQIRSLPTLHTLSAVTEPGTQVGRVAGLAILVDESIEAIERDVDTIHMLERAGIFEVENEMEVKAAR